MFSDLIGPPHIAGGAAVSNSRGAPTPYGGPVGAPPRFAAGGRDVAGSIPTGRGYSGFPSFQTGGNEDRGGAGRGFDSSRGGRASGRGFDRGRGGRGGGRSGYDGGRGGGAGRHGAHGRARDDLDNISLPKQDFGNLVRFEKNFYSESPSVMAMTEQEVALYRARREVTVEGKDIPKPIRMFHEANFPGNTFGLTVYFSILIVLAFYEVFCLITFVL